MISLPLFDSVAAPDGALEGLARNKNRELRPRPGVVRDSAAPGRFPSPSARLFARWIETKEGRTVERIVRGMALERREPELEGFFETRGEI
jgi:hypothetical protein